MLIQFLSFNSLSALKNKITHIYLIKSQPLNLLQSYTHISYIEKQIEKYKHSFKNYNKIIYYKKYQLLILCSLSNDFSFVVVLNSL